MGFVNICDETIKTTAEGYSCRASVEVKGRVISFKLDIPPGTYGKIEANFGRPFAPGDVLTLFEARINQYVESVAFLNREIELGSLDVREVDGLFCDIRRMNRRRRNTAR